MKLALFPLKDLNAGNVLMGRKLGSFVRKQIEDALSCTEKIILDFEEIAYITPSFCEEAFVALPSDLWQRMEIRNANFEIIRLLEYIGWALIAQNCEIRAGNACCCNICGNGIEDDCEEICCETDNGEYEYETNGTSLFIQIKGNNNVINLRIPDI